MNVINILDLFRLKQAILKKIDKEIVNHGIETAYVVTMIANELGYSKEEIYYLAISSFLHDLGAYKTEEMNNLKQFEVVETGRHSIYGYALFNQIKLLKHMAPSILYHHHSYRDKNKHIDNIEIPDESFLIGLGDRVSIFCNLLEYNEEKITKYIYSMKKYMFNPKHLDILYKLIENEGLIRNIVTGKYKDYLEELMESVELDMDLIKECLILLPISIDFFSFETSTHTVSVSCMAKQICNKMNLSQIYKEKIEIASYLHDLGKVCTPKHILEKKGRLTEEEFEIMKEHVSYSKEILEDAYIGEELINLAYNHHEKLDGSGYSRGLYAKDLSIGDRIISISDIFCALIEERHYKKPFSKSKVLEILFNMVESNYIDKEIVEIVSNNYDEFLEYVNINSLKYKESLNKMLQEYDYIKSKIDKLDIH